WWFPDLLNYGQSKLASILLHVDPAYAPPLQMISICPEEGHMYTDGALNIGLVAYNRDNAQYAVKYQIGNGESQILPVVEGDTNSSNGCVPSSWYDYNQSENYTYLTGTIQLGDYTGREIPLSLWLEDADG